MKNKTVKNIFSYISLVLLVITFIGTIYHFIRGIHLSLFENDVKTAQDRIRSAYQFLMMLASGLCLLGSNIFFFKMKDNIIPNKIQVKLGIDSKDTLEEAK